MSKFNLDAIKAGSLSISANREINISMILDGASASEVRGNASTAYDACKSLTGADKGTVALYASLAGFTDKALASCGWTSGGATGGATGFTSLVDAERGKIAKRVIRLVNALAIVREAFEVVLQEEANLEQAEGEGASKGEESDG